MNNDKRTQRPGYRACGVLSCCVGTPLCANDLWGGLSPNLSKLPQRSLEQVIIVIVSRWRTEQGQKEEWVVKRIQEDDFGCEEGPDDVKVKVLVTLVNENGLERLLRVDDDDDWLYANGIDEGS